MVSKARYQAARSVNKELMLTYYYIGTEILNKQKQDGWGSKIIQKLSKDLSNEFPDMKGFSVANLHNMRRLQNVILIWNLSSRLLENYHGTIMLS